MKILITGAAGYIGSALTLALSAKENVSEVVAYDTLSRGDYGLFLQQNTHHKVTFVQANILDNHTLSKALQDCDVVFHLAAKVVSPDSDNDSQYFEQVNNWGTSIVVNEAAKADVKHFIYLSTVYVYGQGSELKTTEDTPLPNSFYGISKLRGEEHLMSLPKRIKHHIIRTGSVYGFSPSTRFNVLINQLLFQAHFSKKVAIHGQGNQVRPFIHIDKLVESLVQLPEAELDSGIYNMVEHNASVNDIVEALQKLYPELEYNHVNRHIKMKDVIVKQSDELIKHAPYTLKNFEEEMRECSEKFW